jgi:hypothetical protein
MTFLFPSKSSLTYMWLFALFAVNALAVVFIPITPDEYSRYNIASDWLNGGGYDYSWPPLLILINVLTSYFKGDLLVNRFVFLVFEFLLLMYIARNYTFKMRVWGWGLLMPYGALVLSLASPQGLMIVLIPVWICFVVRNKLGMASLVAFVLYLVNPTCVLIFVTCGILGFFVKRFHHRGVFLFSSLLAFASLQILSIFIWSSGDLFMPTLTSNGPLNLLLGNNAHPLSYRGVAESGVLDANTPTQYLSLVKDFFLNSPLDFWLNFCQKLIYWFAPFDYFRSGIGGNLQNVLFVYVGFSQLICYFVFVREFRNCPRSEMQIAILIFFMAWLVYSIFFVKMRFRIPFDILLYITAVMTVKNTSNFKSNTTEQ